MRFIEDLCPPALLYLIFLAVNLGLDFAHGMIATMVVKGVLGVAVVLVLDMFCGMGLGVVSWFVVALPFIVTALGTSIAMGLRFDELFVREKFLDKHAKTNDLPADSNAITIE
jgi:type IV secretory pathway TrbD component